MNAVLDDAVRRWRAADLIDPATADAIRRFESEHGADSPAATTRVDGASGAAGRPDDGILPSGRAGLVAEGLAYLGAALAFGAGLALFGQLWTDLGGVARTLVALTGTLAVGGAAMALGGGASDAVRRLRSMLSALAVVGVAVTVGVGLGELTSLEADAVAFAAGAAALVVAIPVHLSRPSWPTTLALGAAVLTTLLGGEFVIGLGEDELPVGVTLIGVGLAWAALGWSGSLRPRGAVETTGLLTGGVGVQVLALETFPVAALVVGLVVAAAALAVGMLEERTGPAVLGGLGITVFAPQLVFELFGDTIGGPLALFVGGLALVTVAVVVLRQRSEQ